ncbi:putative quinol monooxygenase [Flavobacterium sp. NKUCC04_CG]|uniref:putative quinol monooxygenase n=1 Tax=Flavobacterium sp. NKUCC04_CG TaxID=2842121 RepID=UPI001C5A709B|nr:putative quinol monooxygenase [Flavobacterium sp. NKUCC04_CG]MBW3518096.1 antibiotic biosynthesis monooxygenase [Flavobacterium sp. NKUCC04_CG]
MIYLTAIIKVKPEYRTELTTVLKNMVNKTKKETACIQYDLHQGLADSNTFVFYEIWKDQEGLDAHNQQDYIREFGLLASEKLSETPQLYLTNKL